MGSSIDLKRKKADVLVVHCSDPRFQTAYRSIIDSLGKYYDLLVFPGASKAVVDHDLVVDSIKLLHGLHHFEQVHILNHVNCGAFGEVENEIEVHGGSLKSAKEKLETQLPVSVKAYLVDENGQATLRA